MMMPLHSCVNAKLTDVVVGSEINVPGGNSGCGGGGGVPGGYGGAMGSCGGDGGAGGAEGGAVFVQSWQHVCRE